MKELLDCFVDIAPPPQPKSASERLIDPNEDNFSGFVFKIHANIDPNHRSRIAFVKIVSGEFKRNKNYYHVREKKLLKFSSPLTFLASKRSIVDSAVSGDIVGLPDTGNFRIGDSISCGEEVKFLGIPNFSPEPNNAKNLFFSADLTIMAISFICNSINVTNG